jgi:chaperonin GroES
MKINVSKIRPLAGYVLVEPAEKDTVTASGIVLPMDTSEKPQSGKVLAIGESVTKGEGKGGDDKCKCHDCERTAQSLGLKVGDKVIYKKWGGNDVKIDDTEYQFLKTEDILAKLA